MLNVLEHGDLFGEIALLDVSTRTASAVAMEQADLLRIHRARFLLYIKANPDLILAMLTLLCQRLRWTSSVIEDAAFLAFSARLAKWLLVLAEHYRRPHEQEVTVALSRHTWAAWSAPAAKRSTSNSPLALCRDSRYRARPHCDP